MTGGAFALEAGPADASQRFAGEARIRGPKSLQLPVITICLLGVQIFWSVEMSYASPYLLSLGVSKSHMAIVFLAGPLSGLVMQPLIGVVADSSTSRFGRRRPYMFVATLICIVGMLLLGWTREVANWFTSKPDALTIGLAVLSIYLIDFGINAVQAVDRALLVDTLPSSDQPTGNAWAACMLGVGSVVGFFVGNLNLTGLFPFFGKSQLAVLSVIGSILLLACQLTTISFVKERILLKSSPERTAGGLVSKSFTSEVKEMFTNLWSLPRVIKQICVIQFFSWIAWFPLLFYTTMYIGDLHKRAFYSKLSPSSPTPSDSELKALDIEATRLGSRALFYSSIVTLVGNIFLPFFISKKRKQDHNFKARGCRIPPVLQLSLASLWAVGQAVYTGCMLGTFFTVSVPGATFLITLTGLAWAVTQWVPFALLAEAILTEPLAINPDDSGSIRLSDTRTQPSANSRSSDRRSSSHPRLSSDRQRLLSGGEPDSAAPEDGYDSDSAVGQSRTDVSNGGYNADNEDDDAGEDSTLVPGYDSDEEDSSPTRNLSSKAGIILGIHNIFIVIPQFLVTGLASIIFAIYDPQKSVLHGSHPGNTSNPPLNSTDTTHTNQPPTFSLRSESMGPTSNSVVYVFRIGGVSALIAFLLCCRLSRELRHR